MKNMKTQKKAEMFNIKVYMGRSLFAHKAQYFREFQFKWNF